MKKIFIKTMFVIVGMLLLSTKVYAGNVALLSKDVPENIYEYDALNFGGKYYDFQFSFKIANNPPDMGTQAQVNAVVYFEADINGQSVNLSSALLKNGTADIPTKTTQNGRIVYVTNMIAAEHKGQTVTRTVRIPMALLSSITRDNNVPLNWKIYNGDDYSEVYANGTINLSYGAVDVSAQKTTLDNSSTYNFLAPIGKLKCMTTDKTSTDGCLTNNIGNYLSFLFKLAIGICATLAVIMLIVNGVLYMGEESVFGKVESKKKMLGALGGLILALASWALLNTINPDLLKKDFVVDTVSIGIRGDNITSIDATNVQGVSYYSDIFLGYMAHQQGAGGIKAIISAANSNSSVPSNIMNNMQNNFYSSDAKKTIGTSELTPSNFLKYWAKKIAAEQQVTTPIYSEIDTALTKAAQDTGVNKSILVTICRIESLGKCQTQSAIKSTNGSYSGLFQLGQDVWNKYKRSTDNDIFDPYANARVAALYFKDNLKLVK